MEYILGDPHFFHNKMLEIRDYNTVESMNRDIVKKINSVINDKYDTLMINGDVSFGNKEQTKEIISQINGYKILIIGNHDYRHSKVWWHDVGFDDVIYGSLLRDNVIISHKPIENLPQNFFNIHAHTHNKNSKFDKSANHFSTSFEKIKKPLLLKNLF